MSGSTVIITSPPDDGDGRQSASRVRVNIEYTPPEFADPATVAKVQKQLQKVADKIVAKYG